MGLSSKQVSTGEGFGWAKNLTQVAGALEFPNMMLRTQQQQQMTAPPLKCPRCESTNTKFCYYNNYNRSQPRHFCKACKRHWTKGGTLRNVPVGGGRKNKRLKTTNSISTNSNTNTTHAATASKNGIQSQQHVQQPQQDLPLEYNNDQKKFCEILYQSLLQPTSCLLPSSQSEYINNSFLASSTLSLDSMLPLPNPLMASSSSFDANFQLPNVSNYSDENGTSEDLTTTTATATTMTTMPVQWQIPTSSAMDTPSNWNWEDLNTFISTDAEQLRDDSI